MPLSILLSDAPFTARLERISVTLRKISSAEIEVMHRKSVGHSRREHGEHAISFLMTVQFSGGAERAGSVGPKIPIVGVPMAAARCMDPLSFEITTSQRSIKAASSLSVVFPHKLVAFSPIPSATTEQGSSSPSPPKTMNFAGWWSQILLLTSINLPGSHLLAGP